MLVKDYFQHQKSNKLSTTKKFLLYEKISISRENKKYGLINKFKLKTKFYKIGVLSIFFVLLSISLYGVMFSDYKNNRSILTFWQGIRDYNNFSHASAIGQIIKAKGYFNIIKDGELVVSDNFSDGDIISLDKFSTITFDISDLIQAKVIGPAKFTVNKVLGNKTFYRIHMLEGNFISVKSKDNLGKQTVEVITNDGVVIKEEVHTQGDKIDFSMVKKNNQALIYNKGTNKIKVTTNKNNNKNLISIVDNNIDNGTGIEKQLVKLIDEFTSTSGDIISGNFLSGGIVLKTGGNQNIVSGNIDNIITKVSIIDKNKQKIKSKRDKQIEKLEQLTYKSFIKGDSENIFKYYLLGKEDEFKISISNLSRRFNEIYNTIGIKEKININNIEQIYSTLEDIILQIKYNSLNKNTVISNLTTLKNRIFILKNNYSFGEYKDLNNNISFDELLDKIKLVKKSYLLFK